MATTNEKIGALASYLDIEPEEIQYAGKDEDYPNKYDEYYTSEGTFEIMDEDEAKVAMYEYERGLIDDIGMDSFSDWFKESIYDHYLDQSNFEEICKESYESYASDIEREDTGTTYANRLIDECVDAGIIDEDDLNEDGGYEGDLDLADELAEKLFADVKEDYNGNFAQWYAFDFGKESLKEYIKNNLNVLDVEDIAEEIAEIDGYGHSLASWDGETREEGGFYIFKQGNEDERSIDFIHNSQRYITVTDIEWVYDEENEDEDLEPEMDVPYGEVKGDTYEETLDNIADYISDETGFCHEGFQLDEESKAFLDLKFKKKEIERE